MVAYRFHSLRFWTRVMLVIRNEEVLHVAWTLSAIRLYSAASGSSPCFSTTLGSQTLPQPSPADSSCVQYGGILTDSISESLLLSAQVSSGASSEPWSDSTPKSGSGSGCDLRCEWGSGSGAS